MSDLKAQLRALLRSIRARLRDYPSVNELLVDGIETSDKLLAEYISQVVDYFNGLPPPLSRQYSWADFPNRSLLIDGVIALVLQSVGHSDVRNFMPSVDGGATVTPHQKGTLLVQQGIGLWQQVTAQMQNLRLSLNANVEPISVGSYELAMEELYQLIGGR